MKQLKSDLAVLDRKITAQLAPKKDDNDGEEIKPDGQKKDNVKEIDVSQQSPGKKSMVAEPSPKYTPKLNRGGPQELIPKCE